MSFLSCTARSPFDCCESGRVRWCCRVLATSSALCCAALCQLGCLFSVRPPSCGCKQRCGAHPSGRAGWWASVVWHGAAGCAHSCSQLQPRPAVLACQPMLASLNSLYRTQGHGLVVQHGAAAAGQTRAGWGWRGAWEFETGQGGRQLETQPVLSPHSFYHAPGQDPGGYLMCFACPPGTCLVAFYCVACLRVCIDTGVARQ